ncbi:MAG: response regulator, partial [Wenzhouxiangellaceae bacterium]|nr:response regulator [Wenzhouxiangellaceae bacterium]
RDDPDLILLDVWMPDVDGISLLREWNEDNGPGCPVVMISGHGSVEAAVEATRHGACDFIEKPVSMARLLNTIRKALAGARAPAGPVRDRDRDALVPDPVGRSPATERLRAALERITASRRNVLISGEPGTGRSTLARWIHTHTEGAEGELVEMVCSPGCKALADLAGRTKVPATVVLDRFDRVDESALEPLARLTARPRAEVRLIAIAQPGLEQRVAAGHFDSALFHRLAEFRLDVAPLRERREDIPDLVRHFTEQLPATENLPYRPFPVPAQNRLRQHDWSGNLLELANVVRGLLAANGDAPVEADEVEALLERADPGNTAAIEAVHSPFFELPLREAREAFERQYLIHRLRRVEGSVGQLAEAVEMERTHLYRKLKQLGIDPKQIQDE